MNKKDLKIVFMGTPDFAVESLRILVENNYNVVGVITMPDKVGGRGHKIQFSAVKKYALDNNLPILQPEKLKDEGFIRDLKEWNADLQIVVAFRMLPEIVWDMPRLGTFNLHGSLLPQYRGAAPINWAIINGEKETGVTTFFLSHEIDTGKIIQQKSIPIAETDNAGIIHDKLMHIGAGLVKETVDAIISDDIDAISQDQFYKDEGELKAAPKIFKDTTCHINWNNTVDDIYNLIRGLSPYPTAWSEIHSAEENISVKIYNADKEYTEHDLPIGSIDTDNKFYLKVAMKNGFIKITELQLPGKKVLKIEELLRGYKVDTNSYFK